MLTSLNLRFLALAVGAKARLITMSQLLASQMDAFADQ
jgi:hypothetical protein